ncbi:MAG: hypothetical protein CBC55_00845 [Gammaproteobacteria bacterium TMED95]|nr:MAG: hypothetical protein CBC55_00845 [Gammaproteobacteria bacterium TMED95]|tara:strand:+ start:13945 stop:14634 length:690 start_codon:yes stop_codon:yes gene_type:complete
MKSFIAGIVLSSALVTGAAQAELLMNGDFEKLKVTEDNQSGAGWAKFDNDTMVGWTARNGYTEVWAGQGGYLSYDGAQLVELNSESMNAMYQLFPTIAGNTYRFSIYYDSRYDYVEENEWPGEYFNVSMQDFDTSDILYTIDVLENDEKDSWEELSFSFVATGDVTRLSIEALTLIDVASGILLDGASVTSVNNEFEFNDGSFLMDVPSPLAIGSLSLVLMGIRRNKID